MGWLNSDEEEEDKATVFSYLVTPFHVLSITLLTLLLPLAFVLLARVYFFYNLSAVTPLNSLSPLPYLLVWSLRYVNPSFLYLVLSSLSVVTLFQCLSDEVDQPRRFRFSYERPKLCFAWILISSFQLCIGLGIEGTIAVGIDGYISSEIKRNLFSSLALFFGLHEIMLCWSRTFVKPVVDDSVYGMPTEDRWIHRVAIAASFGAMWFWRIRNEADLFFLVAEAKKQLRHYSPDDFMIWWLYYLTMIIGIMKVVKRLLSMAIVAFFRFYRIDAAERHRDGHLHGDDEKV